MSVSLIDGHIDGKTNYDRIRNMSVEKMAKTLYAISNCLGMDCKDCLFHNTNCMSLNSIMLWLESEVEGK